MKFIIIFATIHLLYKQEESNKSLNIQVLVQEFYALEAIKALLSDEQRNNFEPMRYSHSRWNSDFSNFRNEYIHHFASAIYDYTVLVVAAELRHCFRQASKHIMDYYTNDQERNRVYKDCCIYKADDILTAGTMMFDTSQVKWNSGFGGDKWKQIAKAGLMRGKVSDCIFIDHCVDLSHNCSIYFDKGAGIFRLQSREQYKSFLDLKLSCEPITLIQMQQGYSLNKLLWRANNLNVFKKQPVLGSFFSFVHDEAETKVFDYHPIKWGDKRINLSLNNIIDQEKCRNDYRYCEDDSDYEQCA